MKINNLIKKQSGAFSIEAIIAIVLVLSAIALLLKYSAGGGDKLSAQDDNSLASVLITCIRDSRTSTTFSGLTMSTVIDSHCLDDFDVINTARDEVINPYNGAITLEVVTFNGRSNQAVKISSAGYIEKACVAAAKHRIKTSPIVEINGTSIKTLNDKVVDPSDITTNCSLDTNVITYTVSR